QNPFSLIKRSRMLPALQIEQRELRRCIISLLQSVRRIAWGGLDCPARYDALAEQLHFDCLPIPFKNYWHSSNWHIFEDPCYSQRPQSRHIVAINFEQYILDLQM